MGRTGRRGARRSVAIALGALVLVAVAAAPAWSAVPDTPDAPTIVAGAAQITVSFSPPNSGSPITSYTATCSPDGGGTSVPRSGASSPIIVFGLVNGTSYSCTVDATNSDGKSAESPGSADAVPMTVPDAPPTPSVVAHDTQVVVTFVAPANNGGSPITTFTATCSSSDGTVVVSATGTASPLTVAPVTDGKTYNCKVSATNAAGTGANSPPSAGVMPIGAPGTPAPPTITPGTNVMQVAFALPPGNGAKITSYTATCTSTDGGETATTSGPGSPINVTGLTNGNTYTCDVSATSSQGTSPVSGESGQAVAIAVPNAPAPPTVLAGKGRVTVSFEVPAEKADQVFETTATCTSSNGGATRSATFEPEDSDEPFSPIVVTGLTNGKTYTCAVSATNNVGIGPMSPPSAPVVPRVPPGPPTIVKVVSGNAPKATGPANVTFNAGVGNGSAITSFRSTCRDLKNGHTASATGPKSPLFVAGLTTGHLYSCVVFDISLGGTSVASAPVRVVIGTPGQPQFTHISQKKHGVMLTFAAPVANGSPITTYVARCTSVNGGVAEAATSTTDIVSVSKMTVGKTYSCLITANNARGAGATVKVAPIKITN